MAHGAGLVEEDVGGGGSAAFHGLFELRGGIVAVLAGGGGVDAEPDDALAGEFLLQFLHVAGVVMLVDDGAVGIRSIPAQRICP